MTKALEHSPETLARWGQHLDDGWPYTEIAKTYGVSAPHVAKHFPGRGMSRTEHSQLGWTAMKAATGTLKGRMEHEAARKN